ncbi:MAG TPA: hypothetical protein VH143_01605 [Kofleriaceae bacterium]|jgi:hypothetical protein|nr:hypothetical protein [Kofleriaceae bacterium]
MIRYALLAALLVGCTTMEPEKTSTQFVVTVVSPASLGDVNNRLTASGSGDAVTISVQAFDENDQPEDGAAGHADYNNTVGVYVHYLGTLTPYLTGSPLASVPMTHGTSQPVSFTIPPVYGPTTIWVDDDSASGTTFAAGTSPTLWFRDPFTADTQRPVNEMSIDALYDAPLDNKNVTIAGSQYGSNGGALVVTSVYAAGYTIADVQCAPGPTPPCARTDYGFMDVYSFSAPEDGRSRFIVEGEVIDGGYSGGVSEFDGLTELGFPQSFVNADTPLVNPALEPAPAVFDMSWFGNKIMFERNESGMIEIDNPVVCALDSAYTTYKEWKIDPSGAGDAATCAGDNVIDVVSAGAVELDPGTLVGQTLPKIIGNLRPINIGSYNVWIIYPRSMADITTP